MTGTIPIPGFPSTTWRDRILERTGGLLVLIVGAGALMALAAFWIAMILIAHRILH
jgi:hypothetical protein